MDAQDVITWSMALINIGQFVVIFKNWKSDTKKEGAIAKFEEGNSVEKTQDIYDKLTTRMDLELEKRDKRIDYQDKVIETQNEEIAMLRLTVEGYKEKCKSCSLNDQR